MTKHNHSWNCKLLFACIKVSTKLTNYIKSSLLFSQSGRGLRMSWTRWMRHLWTDAQNLLLWKRSQPLHLYRQDLFFIQDALKILKIANFWQYFIYVYFITLASEFYEIVIYRADSILGLCQNFCVLVWAWGGVGFPRYLKGRFSILH